MRPARRARYAGRVTPRALFVLLAVACDPAPESAADEPVVPALPLCEPVAEFATLAVEDALLAQINALRRDGGTCGALRFLPAPPLAITPELRCIARLHSKDMAVRGFLAQVDPDGLGTDNRLDAVGVAASTFAENVGFVDDADLTDAEDEAADAIVRSWQDNPTTCWKLYARELTDLGVGAVRGSYDPKDTEAVVGVYWTATFTAP